MPLTPLFFQLNVINGAIFQLDAVNAANAAFFSVQRR